MGKGPKIGQGTFDQASGLANNFGGMANAWSKDASSSIAPVRDYWQGMLQGGQGAQNLVAPQAMNISRVYQGADKAMQNFMPAGGERNLARAQAGTERARSIADLYANVQPYAASQLSDIGFKQAGAGAGFGSLASQGYGQQIEYQGQRNQAKGAALGGIGAGLGALGGGFAARCWVAEALYGIMHERTLTIRRWLQEGKLAWHWRVFRVVYTAIGKQTAVVAKSMPIVRALLRPVFDAAYRKASADGMQCLNQAFVGR